MICWNFEASSAGEGQELEFGSVPHDIIRRGRALSSGNPKRSLRTYMALLYVKSRMRLMLQGTKVGQGYETGTESLLHPRKLLLFILAGDISSFS